MNDMQAWLDQGKALADRATEGPWFTSPFEHDPVWGSVVTGGVDEHEEDQAPCIEAGDRKDAEFIADARTRLPQALNALQAVRDLHKPEEYDGYPHGADGVMCAVCLTEYDTYEEWPCATVRAIQDALGENNE